MRAALMIAFVPGAMACDVEPGGSPMASSERVAVFAQHGGPHTFSECADLGGQARGLCSAYYASGCGEDPTLPGCDELFEQYEDLGQGPIPGTEPDLTCWCDFDGDAYYGIGWPNDESGQEVVCSGGTPDQFTSPCDNLHLHPECVLAIEVEGTLSSGFDCFDCDGNATSDGFCDN